MAPESWSCHSELLTHFLPFSTFCQKQSKQISTELLKKRGSPFLIVKESGEFPRLICWIWFWYANIFCRKTECTWHSCHRQGVCFKIVEIFRDEKGESFSRLARDSSASFIYTHVSNKRLYKTKRKFFLKTTCI